MGRYRFVPYARLPVATASKNDEKAAAELADILAQLRELRGDGYLKSIRRRAAVEAILVTIEKH